MQETNSSGQTVEIGLCYISTYLKSKPTPEIIQTNIIIIVIDVILVFFTVIINSLFIWTYRKRHEIQNTPNLLLVVLAIGDVLVGCLAEPLVIIRSVMETYEVYNCTLWGAIRLVMIFCSGMSFLTIIVITHDRYAAIFHPLRYPVLFNSARLKLIFLACGLVLVGLLLSRAFMSNVTFFLIISALTFYTTISAIVVYTKIMIASRRQTFRVISMQPGSSFASPHEKRRVTVSLHELKTTKVMIYIVGAMVLCYFPGSCFWIYSNYHGYTLESLYTIIPYLETALFLNSAINPVVYILRLRPIRVALMRTLRGPRVS